MARDNDNIDLLFVLRFDYAPDGGIQLEDCTRRAVDFELRDYCGALLGEQLISDNLRRFRAQLFEFDEMVMCRALVAREYATAFSTYLTGIDGYTYTPYGREANGFGYHSNTVCWLVPQQQAPCLYWNINREPNAEALAMDWIEGYAKRIESGELNPADLVYPSITEENKQYVVPEVYEAPDFRRPRRVRSHSLVKVT